MKKLFLLLFLIPNLVVAASFDCTKASTKHEKMICDNPELNKADEAMGELYFLALKTFKEDAKEIKIAQKEFNKKYRKCKVLDKCLSVINQRVDKLSQRFGDKIIEKKEKDSFCTTSNTDKSTLSNYSIIAVNAAYNLQKELIDAVNTSNLEKLNKLFTHDLLASIKLKDLKSSDYALILKNDYKKLLNDKGISCNSVGSRGWMLASGKVWIQAYKDEVRIISLHK